MKAYKATYNMECLGLTYAVGETYTHEGYMGICEAGFHFCKQAIATLNYYAPERDFILLEIEVLGDIKEEFGGDKAVTNKFKVIRAIPRNEYPLLLGLTYDENGNLIKQVEYNGKTYESEYDHNNNRIKETGPSGKVNVWVYEYDEKQNPLRITYPDGSSAKYTYNGYGSCINVEYK